MLHSQVMCLQEINDKDQELSWAHLPRDPGNLILVFKSLYCALRSHWLALQYEKYKNQQCYVKPQNICQQM